MRFVSSLKRREVISQTDGQAAILLVAHKIASELRASDVAVTMRQTPRYDSRAKCAVENANDIVAGRRMSLLPACASKRGVEFDTASHLFPGLCDMRLGASTASTRTTSLRLALL